MKRSQDDDKSQEYSKRLKKHHPLCVSYFLPINSGLTYSNIIGFRVIEGDRQCPPTIHDFHSLKEAEKYVQISEIKSDYCLIRAIVNQKGFYLENPNGKIIDINTNKKYQFVNISRISELDLNYLNYQPIFQMT